jgi:ABC-type Fe3+-citrate transport system substrate-binding protein
MNSVSIGQIQKNISLITKLKDPVMIIDKRKHRNVAVIYPISAESVINSLAGKYQKRISTTTDLER